MSNAINVRIKNKAQPESTWNTTLSNYVLLSGELAFATTSDNFKFKVGNGVSAWHDLPSFSNIVNIAESAYIDLVENGKCDPDITYVVSSEYVNAYGQQIKNVMAGSNLSDAVNVGQLNQLSGNIVQGVNQSVSALSGSISALSGEVVQCLTSADLMEPIIWSALVNKRNNSQLVPGKSYRIIDYVTTTNGSMASRSAGNQFDLIVTAIAPNKLSEIASADKHEGTSYFNNSDMQAWKIWYRLDNDTCFDWAVTSANGGKGVIYRMIDEFNNDVPYDFKNIQFRPYGVVEDISSFNALPESGDPSMIYYVTSTSASYKWNPDWTSDEDKYVTTTSGVWYYTFNRTLTTMSDSTILQSNLDNYHRSPHNTCIKSSFQYYVNIYSQPQFYLTEYWKNKLNRIVILRTHTTNNMNSSCNTFENGCYCITFDSIPENNTFGIDCHHMHFGTHFKNNTFGKDCAYIKFVNMLDSDISANQNYVCKNFIKNVTVEDGNSGIILNMTGTTSDNAYYRNMTIRSGTNNIVSSNLAISSDIDFGVTTYKVITDPTNGGQEFNTTFKPKNSLEVSI